MLFALDILYLNREPEAILPQRALRLPFFYGAGIFFLVLGLGWSGLHGVPRKAPHDEFSMEGGAYLVGMGLAGIGGFVALCAVIVFVWTVVRDIRGVTTDVPRRARRDVRLVALVATLVAIVAGGLLLGSDVSGPGLGDGARAHVADKKRKEIDLRFQQGVVMLHARQYEHALTAFHRVIELAPQMPEAYVNAGFALLGKGEFQAAADFFDEATNLRRDQINAYFGLALALDGLGNRRGALEAMRTFLHRASPDDPYRSKADAAISEWQAALAPSRPAHDLPSKP
jgi:Flp pilus assembly protein TadD